MNARSGALACRGRAFCSLATAGDLPGPRGAPQPEFLWRPVAGNNHVLGRSPWMYRELAACRAAITRLVEGISRAEPAPSAASRPGCWSWGLVLPVEITRGTRAERHADALSVRVPPGYCALMDPDENREPPAPASAPSERADEDKLSARPLRRHVCGALLLDVWRPPDSATAPMLGAEPVDGFS